MKKVVYYIATSLDGFIASKEDDISGFIHDEAFVSYYYEQLNHFETVIMGKNTYEFGYKFGLEAGKNAYKHMDHYIFSKSIDLPSDSEVKIVRDDWIEKVKELKSSCSTDIYLCGGSQFAGLLASKSLIDEIWIKLNPFVMGGGKPIFGGSHGMRLKHFDQKEFDCGIIEHRYSVDQG